jgi:GNAT superfamily N-acetyltransferase
MAAVASLWHDSWHLAHDDIVPTTLVQARTVARFARRLREMLPKARVVGPVGGPIGFCVIDTPKLDQLYVARAAHGKGVAQSLMQDAEVRLAATGATRAYLLCAAENARAAAFYRRCGWALAGVAEETMDDVPGDVRLRVLRFEKDLPFKH